MDIHHMVVKTIDPTLWREHARRSAPADPLVTDWLAGTVAPVHIGWYDRFFTDGLFRHYWDGQVWRARPDCSPHWRQVGDYPAWRGSTSPLARANDQCAVLFAWFDGLSADDRVRLGKKLAEIAGL